MTGAGGLGGHGGQTMHMDDDHDEHHGLDEASLKEHEEVTKVKVRYIYALDRWTYARTQSLDGNVVSINTGGHQGQGEMDGWINVALSLVFFCIQSGSRRQRRLN